MVLKREQVINRVRKWKDIPRIFADKNIYVYTDQD